MGLTQLVAIIGIALFAGASFFFSLAETALFSLSKWQIRQLAERHPLQGGMAARLLTEPQDLLATMALGNTFASAAILAIALRMLLVNAWPVWPTVVALLVLILLVGEVLPKTLAVRAPEAWALRVVRPLSILQGLARPFRLVAQKLNAAILGAVVPVSVKSQAGLTEADYHELLDLAQQHGALAREEKEIILRIISLDRRAVREVMRPRSQMAMIPDDLSVEEMLAAARRLKHRRLPMHDASADTIVSVLNTRALLLNPQADLLDVIEFPSFVPESMNLLQLLKSFQRQQRGLAIVLDEFGGTSGLVTMEDILGELVGFRRTSSEAAGFVMERLEAGRWRVSGTMRLDDFRREYSQLGDASDMADVETMGGLLTWLLNVVPAAGESARFRGLKLTAYVADERRIRELLVEVEK